VKIDIPELLLHLRAEIADGSPSEEDVPKRKFGESMAFRVYARMWSRSEGYERSMRWARSMQHLVARDGKVGKVGGVISRLVPPLGAWTAWRDAPVVAPKSFREMWREKEK